MSDRHLEVTAMADCVPFLGVEDLREILTAVLHRKASSVGECRPLKVSNYLQVKEMLHTQSEQFVPVTLGFINKRLHTNRPRRFDWPDSCLLTYLGKTWRKSFNKWTGSSVSPTGPASTGVRFSNT